MKAATFRMSVAIGALGLGCWSIPLGQAAIIVNSSAGLGLRTVADADGRPLPNGQWVRVGTFAPGFDVTTHGADLFAVAGAWREFNTTTIRAILGRPGRFACTASSSDPGVMGQRIHWWILQTRDDAAPQPDLGNVVAYGLYSCSANHWMCPAQDAIPPLNTRTLSSSEVDLCFHGAVEAEQLRLAPASGSSGLSFSAWRSSWFGAADCTPAATDGADPDADGLVNLVEYGLGTNPLVPDAQPVQYRVETEGGETYLVLRLNWRRDRPEAEIGIQSSPDLRDWGVAAAVQRRIVAESMTDQTIEFWLSGTGAAGFLQVQVTRA